MRPDAAQADRRYTVRSAAAAWRRAGAIDEATLRAITVAYPDDRARGGLGLRILAGGAGLVGGAALAGLFFAVFGGIGSVSLIILAAIFAAATELQTGRLRRADAGAELATAILAVGFAGAWIASFDFESEAVVFTGFAVVSALAAWRWGHAILAAFAAFTALLGAGQFSLGHLLWLAAGGIAFPLILGLARSVRQPPAHRRCFWAAGVVLLLGAYLATNVYCLDHRWLRWLADGPALAPAAWLRVATIAGTIVIPPVVFAAGVRYRDRALLVAGTVFTAASLVTLRYYYPVGPWWLALIAAGIATLSIAVWLRRWLHAGPGHERFGFTAEPLFEDRRAIEAARAAAVLAAVSPAARVAEQPGFEGGGGRSGGGGATGSG